MSLNEAARIIYKEQAIYLTSIGLETDLDPWEELATQQQEYWEEIADTASKIDWRVLSR